MFSATTCCAWVRVAAVPQISWPSERTRSSSCIEISGSSSMISTLVAVSRSISSTASCTSWFTSSSATSMISPASAGEKSSTVVSSSAWRLTGVIRRSWSCAAVSCRPWRRALVGDFEIGARPHLVERAVERHAAAAQRFGEIAGRPARLRAWPDESIAGRLRAGQSARVAAKKRQMSGDFGPDRHRTPSRRMSRLGTCCGAHWFRRPDRAA